MKLHILSMLTILSLLIVGCGGSEPAAPSEQPAPTEPAQTAPAVEETTQESIDQGVEEVVADQEELNLDELDSLDDDLAVLDDI